MIVKIHKVERGKMFLAVCDSELIGKKFEDDNKQLDLTSDFYKGDEKTDQEICDLMRNSYIMNLVGEKTTKLALKEEIIINENIKRIANIPYAQVVMQDS